MFSLIIYLSFIYSAFALPIINPSADAILFNKPFTRPIPHFNPKPSMRFCKRDGCIPTIKSWFSKLIEKIKLAWAKVFKRKPKAKHPSPPNVKIQEHSNALYEILNVSPTASNDEINAAYRKISLASHPDKTVRLTEAEKIKANERFAKAKDAKELLLNPQSRAHYDAFGTLDEIQNLDPKLAFQKVFGGSGFSDFIVMEDEPLGKLLIYNLQTPFRTTAAYDLNQNLEQAQEKLRQIHKKLLMRLTNVLDMKGSDQAFENSMRQKVESLKEESLGVPLLHVLGKAYADAAKGKSVGFWKTLTVVYKLYSQSAELSKLANVATFEERFEIQKKHWAVLWSIAEFQIFTSANNAALDLVSQDSSRAVERKKRLKILSELFQNAE